MGPSKDYAYEVGEQVFKDVRKLLEETYYILYKELRKVTQRINLFEKKLIPEYIDAEGYLMQRLGDMERHATIIAKVAKRKFFETSLS